jgi:hypothetical protein
MWVDNLAISKYKLDLIAQKILQFCNITHNKSANNNNKLKSGNGKVMITSGLTVNEFKKKYNLPV